MPDLVHFRQTARGGYLGLDSQGGLINVGRLQHRAASLSRQVTRQARSDAEVRENRTVIGQFISAIEESGTYGPEFVQSARTQLQTHIATGKRLGERQIEQVLTELDSQASIKRSSNHAMAGRFSNPVGAHQDTEPNINSEWSRLRSVEGAAHLPDIDPDNYFARSALHAIREEILALGADGRHAVTEAEARQIAEPHLARLVEQAVMDEMLEAAPLNSGRKGQLREQILAEPALNSDNIANRANLLRANKFVNFPGTFSEWVDESWKRADLAGDKAKFKLKPGLKEKVVSELVGELGLAIPGGGELKRALQTKVDEYARTRKRLQDHVNNDGSLSEPAKAAACDLILADPSIETEQQLDDLIASRRSLLEHVDRHGVLRQEKIALCNIVLADRSVNNTADIDRIVAAGPACKRLCTAVGIVADHDHLSDAYTHYRDNLGNISLEMGLHGLALIGAQAKAGRGGTATRSSLRDAWVGLSSQSAQEMKSSAQWLTEQHGDVEGAEEVGREFSHFVEEAPKRLAGQLSLTKQDQARAFTGATNIAGEQDVPDAAYTMFRDQGAKIPRPNPLGREQLTYFGTRFQPRFLESARELVMKDDYDKTDGMHPKMSQEFGRATFVTKPNTRILPPSMGDNARWGANTFFVGDSNGKELVSRLANPSIFMEFPTAIGVGDGPLAMAPQAADGVPQERTYTIERVANGDYHITAQQMDRVASLRDPSDGSVVETDPDQSHLEYRASLRLRQVNPRPESGDRDPLPEVTLLGRLRCSYKFVPKPSQLASK